MLEMLGLLGGLLFSLSSIPMLIQTLKNKHARYIPLLTAISIAGGAWCMFAYLIIKNGLDWIVVFDYMLTCVNWTIILFLKIFPQDGKSEISN